MSKLKFIMKQYWRIGTVRALLSLAMSMFVLGRLYYEYIPALADLGLVGALFLGSVLLLIFMGIGWVYDEKIKMWSPNIQSIIERNAFQYIPDPKTTIIDYPVLEVFYNTMEALLEKLGLATDSVRDINTYLERYFKRKISREDIFSAYPDSVKYLEEHPFTEGDQKESENIGLIARIKLGFQVGMLRLNWIQALTGLFQDVLVFGTFYIVLFTTGGSGVGSVVTLDVLFLGFVFISFPLFIGLALAGWVYDKKLKVWTSDTVVKVERNPFTYLAPPKFYIIMFPFYAVLFNVMRDILIAAEIDTEPIDRLLNYLEVYSKLDVAEDDDMQRARKLRKEYGKLFIQEN